MRQAIGTFTLVVLGALGLYLSTMAPSLTWAHFGSDGGDLISAALTNGVPHPPGYPTFVTLGALIASLPLGDLAYRFNVFSAVCMALAAGLTALTLLRLMPSDGTWPRFTRTGLALMAAFYFVTAPMVWGQATIAEVHGLNAGLVAAIVYLVAPIVFRDEPISSLRLTLAAWLWGAALGNSVTAAALAPLCAVAWWRSRQTSTQIRSWLPFIGLGLGLSLYALIPLRAAQQPPINWGDAITPDRFIALISAEMYHGLAFNAPTPEILARLIAAAQALVTQYGWLGVLLSGLGVYFALLSPNHNWRWLALVMALYLGFALSYATPDSALYLIPVWMFGVWAVARGMMGVIQHLHPTQPLGYYALLLLIFLGGPVLTSALHFDDLNLRSDHAANDFAQRVLTLAPLHALVVTETDGHTFALWYHRLSAGARPDVAIVDRRLAGYPWYETMLRVQGATPQLPEYDPPATWLNRLSALNADRAVCVVAAASGQMTCR